MSERSYPFIPKSTKSLQIGDYWKVKLEDGLFGCVVVTDLSPNSTKYLVVGLTNWQGTSQPTIADLQSIKILDQGTTYIQAIAESSPGILGNLKLPEHVSGISLFKSTGEIGEVTKIYGYKNLSNSLMRALSQLQ